MDEYNKLKVFYYHEALQEAINTIEQIQNVIIKNYQTIDKQYVKKQNANLRINLEIEIAKYSIILRKMFENNYIKLTDNQRRILNSSIHSISLRYENGILEIASRSNNQNVSLGQLLSIGKQVLIVYHAYDR